MEKVDRDDEEGTKEEMDDEGMKRRERKKVEDGDKL